MEKMANRISVKRRIESAIIIVFCAVVFVTVFCVLSFAYDPSLNSVKALGTVSMDIISMSVLLVLVLGVVFEKGRLSKTTKLFLCLLLATMFALLFDFLTWAFDGALNYEGWTYLFTVSSLCMGAVLACIFIAYLCSYFIEMYELNSSKIHALICIVLDLIAFGVTIYLAISNKAFVFADGHYSPGPYYDYVTVIPVLTLVYMTIFSICHVKKTGLHDLLAVIGYITIMIVGALIEADYGVGATYVSVTLADIFIFMMLQNRQIDRMNGMINEEKRNVEKWIRRSRTDEMTGFYNRQAYENEIANLEKSGAKDAFVYVSMDVNGLKVVNDNLGHAAGDELIIGACDCMNLCLGAYGKLFRTGGDEFVALIHADAKQLATIKNDLAEVTSKWHGKYNNSLNISCGYVTKTEAEGMSLHQVAVLADKRMYEDKTRYYQKKGVDRRGQKDAHVALVALYAKILKVNITDDSYQIVNMNKEEQTVAMGFSDKYSMWMRSICEVGLVHEDDRDSFIEKTEKSYLEEYFENGNDSLRIFYRRKFGAEYKHCMLEVIRANDYSDESKNLFLYVKDIEKLNG